MMLGQLLVVLLQLTSHLHELAQSMLGHADCPLQSIWHAFVPQLMLRHAFVPPQMMSQPLPEAQSMSPQAFALLQRIVQAYPAGHWTAPHDLPALQSIMHVLAARSQDEHGAGQAPCSFCVLCTQ